ncbi:MAG TPA: anti-sigma factor [Sediminibacterium sp.]|nr:anti-sigma factor [Sediminibacterium sp.]
MDIRAYIESGAIESYVLGIADQQEAAEFEQLAAQYPEIRAAREAFEASLEQMALADAITPPPEIEKALLDQLSFQKPAGKVKHLPVRRYMAAAAVILLVASAGLNFYLYTRLQSTHDAYTSLLAKQSSLLTDNQAIQTRMLDMYNSMQLMSDTSIKKVSMTPVPGKSASLATIFWDTHTKDVYLLPNKLAKAAPGKQYQLWAIVDGKPVDAGVMGECAGLCRMKNIPRASAFAITLEKEGGSPTPTMSQLLVFGKVS